MKKHRIIELDYLRSFACIAVLGIHTFSFFQQVRGINFVSISALSIDNLCCFAVPMFIFISGFALYYSDRSIRNYFIFYKKRFLSIIPPYIFFSLFYLVANNWDGIISHQYVFSFKKIIYIILTGQASFHLWFFTILIQFYLLFPLFIKIYNFFKDRNKGYYLLLITAIIQIFWEYFFYYRLQFFTSSPLIDFFRTYQIFLEQIFYFTLGIYVCDNYKYIKYFINKNKSSILIFLLMITLTIYTWITVQYYFLHNTKISQLQIFFNNFVLTPIIFLNLFKLSFFLKNYKFLISKYFLEIGKYSFGIYLIHIYILNIIVYYLINKGINPSNGIFYFIIFSLLLFVPYAIVKLVSYLPYSKYVIGIQSKK